MLVDVSYRVVRWLVCHMYMKLFCNTKSKNSQLFILVADDIPPEFQEFRTFYGLSYINKMLFRGILDCQGN